MENIHDSVTWYQQKIGSYDKQLWEQSVEQKVLKGIKQAKRRTVKPRTQFIDVDLIRGSTFTKAKPQVPWTYITVKTFSRVVLCPFHYKWWIQQTSLSFWLLLMLLYVMQILAIIVFFSNVGDELFRDELSLMEVTIPCVLMVLLGLIHSQTVLAHLKPPIRDTKRDTWRRKRSLSQNRTVSTSSDVPASPSTQAAEAAPSQSKPSSKSQPSKRSLRSKERKVRLKQSAQKPVVRPENISEKGSQDSESAYNTLEASDSIAERTSSVEQDSCSNERRKDNSSSSDGVNEAGFTSPVVHNEIDVIEAVREDWDGYRKCRESQESDLPQDSNSEDEKFKEGNDYDEKSKRNSQSISSENETEDADDVKADSVVESKLISVENVGSSVSVALNDDTEQSKKAGSSNMNNTSNDNSIVISEKIDIKETSESSRVDVSLDVKIKYEGRSVNSQVCKEDNSDVTEQKLSPLVVDNKSIKVASEASDSSFLDVSLDDAVLTDQAQGAKVSEPVVKRNSSRQAKQSLSLNGLTSNLKQAAGPSAGQKVPRPSHSQNSVHFTSDLVNLREITPKSSREGTPTHTQSDGILQTKHMRTAVKVIEIDTETDTDTEVKSTKSLPNLRRRKVPSQETVEITGTTLRHRRTANSGAVPESKASTGVSSSEGETEGQSSVYSGTGKKNMASSEEWGDHLQSDVDTSSESSSCGSEPEISQHEEPEPESEDDPHNINSQSGMTSSNLHLINLLHPTTSTSVTHSPPDKVTCIIWERNECKKVELTAMDIGWAIIETVDKIPESSDYILIGITFSILIGLTPLMFQAFHAKDLPSVLSWDIFAATFYRACCNSWRENLIHVNAILQRLCLSAIYFFMLSVADRTFKQRLLYAKHFCYLTSSRRARKFDMPHFRLNKVRNIRIWLSLRSYLKKRGPQRSVDMIVSSAFLLTLSMLILICLQLLHDAEIYLNYLVNLELLLLRDAEIYLNYLVNWELLIWTMALGIYLLRFMTLGLRINKKYRNLSVLITEQINLYLQMEQKPHKKEELMVANNVLKLAESLIKELESPFKISGISANPLILNVTKVVVLSAFSAVLTELLGFKLKLYKIKLRA